LPVARKVRRIDDLIVGDGRAYIAVRKPVPHCGHSVQAFAYRAIAIRMHVRLEARAGHFDQQGAQDGRREIDVRAAARRGRPMRMSGRALQAQIRSQHGAGGRGRRDHPVQKQLHIAHGQRRGGLDGALIVALRQRFDGGDGRLGIFALRRRDQHRKMCACGELALALHGGESRHIAGVRRRIQKGRDALLAKRHERSLRRLGVIGRRGRRYVLDDGLLRGILEKTRGLARRIVPDLAAQRIRRLGIDSRKPKAP